MKSGTVCILLKVPEPVVLQKSGFAAQQQNLLAAAAAAARCLRTLGASALGGLPAYHTTNQSSIQRNAVVTPSQLGARCGDKLTWKQYRDGF